jgi:hypothetical protein
MMLLIEPLKSGKLDSEGCKLIDDPYEIIGKTFGRLTVKRRIESKNGKRMYFCECSCGGKKNVAGYEIRNGNVKSCGCLAIEAKHRNGKANKKYNEYFQIDDFTMGCYAHNNREIFYFDKEDFEKVRNCCWLIDADNYARTKLNGKSVLFHQLIMDFPGCEVDHKDRNRRNNKKENLRRATDGQNAINASMRKDNVTGVKGVSWNDTNKNWRSILDLNYERVLDKSFKNFFDAVVCRLNAEKQYYKEFAPQKHLFEEYGVS